MYFFGSLHKISFTFGSGLYIIKKCLSTTVFYQISMSRLESNVHNISHILSPFFAVLDHERKFSVMDRPK